jgi:hypothetical protein
LSVGAELKKLWTLLAFLIVVLSAANAHAYGYGRGGHGHGYNNNRGWVAPAVIGGVIAGAIVGSALTAPYYSRPNYYAPMPVLIHRQPIVVQQQPIIVQQQSIAIQQQSNSVDSYYPVMQLAPATITPAPPGYRWQMMINPQNNIAQPVLVPNH